MGWVLGVSWLVARSLSGAGTEPPPAAGVSIPDGRRRPPLTPDEARQIGAFAAAVFRGDTASDHSLPTAFAHTPAVVFLAARKQGERIRSSWRDAPSGTAALRAAASSVAANLRPDQLTAITALEIDLGHGCAPVDPAQDRSRLSNLYRGLRGVELIAGGRPYRIAPTEMVGQNLSFDKALGRLAERAGLERSSVGGPGAPLRTFEADQMIVELLAPGPSTTLLYRGNTLVPVETITRAFVQELADAQGNWLFANLQANGRLVYLYWPSRGQESPQRNALRLWMGSRALSRVAAARADPRLTERAEQNIRYHLAQFYQEDGDGHGLIVEDDGDVKLGAMALAALALIEHPRRADFARQERALGKTVAALWQANGEFRTFWRPKDRTDNVNFYPGEALLFWATLFVESRDPALLDRIMRSVRFYRDWHRNHRNPAFIPWHTQAAFKVWSITAAPELRDWIFEMNDWLLAFQQWESQREFPDTMGRFYDPQRPFGPPHTSSTGVYLEGLAEAWRLARAAGDAPRQEAYRRTVVRALRNIAQNTFLDDLDLFYVARKERVRGGVRTTVYDNAIRVDNVQHHLMAALNLLEAFTADDFVRPGVE